MPMSERDKLRRQQNIDRARNRSIAAQKEWELKKALRELCKTTTPQQYRAMAAVTRQEHTQRLVLEVVDALSVETPLDCCCLVSSRMAEKLVPQVVRRRKRRLV